VTRVLSWLLAILLVGTAVAGVTGAPRERLVLRIDEVAVAEIDPAKSTDFVDSILFFNLYDTLVAPGPGGVLRPHLAERWQVSPDGRRYTFTLRPGVRFHDGTEVTAEDVVFSAQRMMAMKQGYSYLYDGWVQEVRGSGRQVTFTLSKPYGPFLATLVRLGIVNRDLVLRNRRPGKFGANGDYGEAFLGRTDAGSGPYRIRSHNPQTLTVIERFPRYFLGFARNAPDEVRISLSVEAATIRTLMARRQHEVTSQWLPTEIYRALDETPGIGLATERGQSTLFLKINTKRPPTDDLQVRRAMALAFDYQAVLDLIRINPRVTAGKPARGPIPEGFPGHDPSLPAPRRDVEAAKAALAQSKYGAAIPPVEFAWVAEVPLEEKIALLFQQNMAAIGLKVNVVKVPWALMTERAAKPDTTPNVVPVFFSGTYPSPDSFLYSTYHSSAAGSWTSMEWLQHPEVDALLDRARSTVDPDRQLALYKQAQRRIVALVPDIFAYEQFAVFAYQEYVKVPFIERPIPVQGAHWNFRTWEIDVQKRREITGR
jgi:peptide/nickel transport system substrate-binding protein